MLSRVWHCERLPGRLVGLGIVQHDQRRPHALAVRALVLHAADPARDAGHLDDGARGPAAGHGRQHDFAGGPLDVGALSPVGLAGTAVGNALQAAYRVDGLGEVLQQEVVALQLGLDGVEHVGGVALVRADQADELPRAGQDRPKTCGLAEGGLAAAARHGQGEEPALEDGLLDLAHHLQVVGRPVQAEGQREVALAEGPEASRRPLPALVIDHGRHLADVASGGREAAVAGGGRLLHCPIVAWGPLRLRSMALAGEPGGVAHQVDPAAVADAVPGPVALTVDGVGLHHLAERRGVEEPCQLGRPQCPGVKLRHRAPPSVPD